MATEVREGRIRAEQEYSKNCNFMKAIAVLIALAISIITTTLLM